MVRWLAEIPLDFDHPSSLDQKHILTNVDQSRPTLTNYLTNFDQYFVKSAVANGHGSLIWDLRLMSKTLRWTLHRRLFINVRILSSQTFPFMIQHPMSCKREMMDKTHTITSMQGQCGHKWEGDDEPGHSSLDNETLSCWWNKIIPQLFYHPGYVFRAIKLLLFERESFNKLHSWKSRFCDKSYTF